MQANWLCVVCTPLCSCRMLECSFHCCVGPCPVSHPCCLQVTGVLASTRTATILVTGISHDQADEALLASLHGHNHAARQSHHATAAGSRSRKLQASQELGDDQKSEAPGTEWLAATSSVMLVTSWEVVDDVAVDGTNQGSTAAEGPATREHIAALSASSGIPRTLRTRKLNSAKTQQSAAHTRAALGRTARRRSLITTDLPASDPRQCIKSDCHAVTSEGGVKALFVRVSICGTPPDHTFKVRPCGHCPS